MDKRSQLYYLVNEYVAGNYCTDAFCDAFYGVFYPNEPKDQLSEFEYLEFKKLACATARFSQYEEDFINCPNAYVSESEIRAIAKEVYSAIVIN